MYSNVWTPWVGEMLACEQESWNLNDSYVVAIKSSRALVTLFLLHIFLFHPSEHMCRNCTFLLMHQCLK